MEGLPEECLGMETLDIKLFQTKEMANSVVLGYERAWGFSGRKLELVNERAMSKPRHGTRRVERVGYVAQLVEYSPSICVKT